MDASVVVGVPKQHALPLPTKVSAQAPASEQQHTADEQQVATVRGLLPAAYQHHPYADDATVRRFIRAVNGGPLQQAAKRLAHTLKWRDTQQPEKVVCKACLKNPKAHYMHVVGHDSLGRPIIYSCLAAAKNKVYADNCEHMIQTFEMAVRMMPPGVEQWVWVCDFHGFGVSDLNPKLAKSFLDVSAEHYPERLGLFLIVDAPSMFSVLWKAISSFVDPKTYNKIRFLPYDLKSPTSSLRGCLEGFCPPDVTGWLTTEIAENRDNKKLPQKTYSLRNLHRSASRGELLSSPGSAADDQHNLHGSKKLLNLFASSPGLLVPAGLLDSPASTPTSSKAAEQHAFTLSFSSTHSV